MVKREKSIELLNQAVNDELMAVHQYMYFHFLLDDMGYDLLSTYFKRTAIEEMMHVELLAERILFLKGEVEMMQSHAVEKIHDVKAMLDKAEAMETQTIMDYNQFAQEASTALDSATKKLFEDLILQEERHQDQFDIEKDNLANYGDNYLALQSIEHAKKASVGTQMT
ncbi:MAG: bacterioferritin [Dysgonamonadaceae bacterium]|jgi:bacterioferritin|nr:bacterioferritin [Dysgonamonadaceae bacterium]